MRVTALQYAKTLMEVIETSDPKDQDQILDNFVKVLAENNDIKLTGEISEEFHKLELAKKGIKQAEVSSAHHLGRDDEKDIVRLLNETLKADVEIKKSIDENLIGGVIIKVEDRIIDASVKNSLEQLRANLEE